MNLRCLLAFAFSTTLHTMQTEKNVAVPMRDCVVLRADVFWPDEAGSCPMLVLRTSYNKETGKPDAYVKAGYIVVKQDARGPRGRFCRLSHKRTPHENDDPHSPRSAQCDGDGARQGHRYREALE